MKLEELEIIDFRGIDHLKLDFHDELGRIRERLPIVGPNTSGKTTILDAIALCLMPVTDLMQPREELVLTPSSIVRRGALQTRVTCSVWFSDDELEATRELFSRVESVYRRAVPPVNRVAVHWEFPARKKAARRGTHSCDPKDAKTLFEARATAARFLHAPGVGPGLFQRLGGVFSFDQNRRPTASRGNFLNRSLTKDETLLDTARAQSALRSRNGSGLGRRGMAEFRRGLLTLAARAEAKQGPETTEKDDYDRLCRLYEHACRPHRIRGLYNTESGLDMEFVGDRETYLFDGLSSGQEMVLHLLLRFATEHIHRSIVLIDELELHLHPLWQERLYHALGDLGIDNQFFLTTHSTHLRDLMRDDVIHCTGDLGERAVLREGT